MALIICPECGKEISDRAIKCPACAYPINKHNNSKMDNNKLAKEKKNKRVIVVLSCVILTLLLVFFVVVLFFPKNIVLYEDAITLTVGEERILEYDVVPQRAIKGQPSLKSTNNEIVSVSKNKLIAKAEGQCQVSVTTWNGKTSKCKIEVISKKENQQNHIEALSDYITENADQTGNNNISIKQIYSLENDEVFMIAKSENGVCLMFQKYNGIGSNLTMVLLASGDVRKANILDNSSFIVDNKQVSINAKGSIKLAKYKYGDTVNINDVSSENSPSDFEIGVTDESQKRINEGVENAIKYFAQFLTENEEFGKMEDYGFSLSE